MRVLRSSLEVYRPTSDSFSNAVMMSSSTGFGAGTGCIFDALSTVGPSTSAHLSLLASSFSAPGIRYEDPSWRTMTSLFSFEALDSSRVLPFSNSSSRRTLLSITAYMSVTMDR